MIISASMTWSGSTRSGSISKDHARQCLSRSPTWALPTAFLSCRCKRLPLLGAVFCCGGGGRPWRSGHARRGKSLALDYRGTPAHISSWVKHRCLRLPGINLPRSNSKIRGRCITIGRRSPLVLPQVLINTAGISKANGPFCAGARCLRRGFYKPFTPLKKRKRVMPS